MLDRLREARQPAGLTQVEVAERLGAPRQFVLQVELGERRIDPLELRELAGLYGKPLDVFLE